MSINKNISRGDPGASVPGSPDVIDFQATRRMLHLKSFQTSLSSLVEVLVNAADCSALSLAEAHGKDDSSLYSTPYAIFDFVDVKSTDRGGLISTSWSPFVLFSSGEAVLSLRASYGVSGSRMSGISLLVDGVNTKSRCTSLSSAKKICLSYIKTYVRDPDV